MPGVSKRILLMGAGKSATVLIEYLQQSSLENGWHFILADINVTVAKQKWGMFERSVGSCIELDCTDTIKRQNAITDADVVISMLPTSLHGMVATDCANIGRSLFTASYVDDTMRALSSVVLDKQLLFLAECGLDPGIDHMSAMELLTRIKSAGGIISSFKSHCGGLVALESDNNPWHYKISWNPRGIVLAGKAGAEFLHDGSIRSLKYEQIFSESTGTVNVEGMQLAYYHNRNSLDYIDAYGFTGDDSIMGWTRTTLRYPQFMSGWDAVIRLKLTSTKSMFEIDRTNLATVAKWLRFHLDAEGLLPLYIEFMANPALQEQLTFAGLTFDNEETIPPLSISCNAEVLMWLLEDRWVMKDTDKDMVVMMHEIDYSMPAGLGDGLSSHTSTPCSTKRQTYHVSSSLVLNGSDNLRTAMAKTVGLPLAMAVVSFLKGDLKLTGLQTPAHREVYSILLPQLASEGVVFNENICMT